MKHKTHFQKLFIVLLVECGVLSFSVTVELNLKNAVAKQRDLWLLFGGQPANWTTKWNMWKLKCFKIERPNENSSLYLGLSDGWRRKGRGVVDWVLLEGRRHHHGRPDRHSWQPHFNQVKNWLLKPTLLCVFLIYHSAMSRNTDANLYNLIKCEYSRKTSVVTKHKLSMKRAFSMGKLGWSTTFTR